LLTVTVAVMGTDRYITADTEVKELKLSGLRCKSWHQI